MEHLPISTTESAQEGNRKIWYNAYNSEEDSIHTIAPKVTVFFSSLKTPKRKLWQQYLLPYFSQRPVFLNVT